MKEYCLITCESSSGSEHCVFMYVLSVLSGVLAGPHLTPCSLHNCSSLALGRCWLTHEAQNPWGNQERLSLEGPVLHGQKASLGIWLVPCRPPWGGHTSTPDRGLARHGCAGQLATLPSHQSFPHPPARPPPPSPFPCVCVSCPWEQFQMFS